MYFQKASAAATAQPRRVGKGEALLSLPLFGHCLVHVIGSPPGNANPFYSRYIQCLLIFFLYMNSTAQGQQIIGKQ